MIPKSVRPQHIKDNLSVNDFQLSAVLLGSNGSHVTLYTGKILANFINVDQTRKEICAQVMSSSLDARSPLCSLTKLLATLPVHAGVPQQVKPEI